MRDTHPRMRLNFISQSRHDGHRQPTPDEGGSRFAAIAAIAFVGNVREPQGADIAVRGADIAVRALPTHEADNAGALTHLGKPVGIEKFAGVEKCFMPCFAQPNVAGWIVQVDAAEDNSLLAFVDAPHPFDSVAEAGLR